MRSMLIVALFTAAGCAANIGAGWAEICGGRLVRDASGQFVEADFRASWISDPDLAVLGTITTLKVIDLSHTRITDIGFEHLKNLPAVHTLNLYYAEQIGDGAMASLKNWKHLRELNVRGTKVTDVGIGHLGGVSSLESLDAGYALVTDAGFEPLANLPRLKSLRIGGNKMTDVGLSALRLFPALTALDISGAQRTDSGLWSVALTDQGLENIAGLTNLQHLSVKGAKITDTGFQKLAPLTKVKSLDIGDTQLSARGLAILKTFSRLESLDASGAARVTDDIVPLLAALQNLRWVDLSGTKATAAGAERLRASRPGCRVER